MESLSEEDAESLIIATTQKIIEEFNDRQLTKASEEFTRLTKRASVTELSAEDEMRRKKLGELIRNNLK